LLIAALNIMASQGITAALGYGFWLVVSRRADVAAIGLSSSVLSAVAAAALLSSIGIAVSALQEVRPRSTSHTGRGPHAHIRISLLSTLTVSVVAGPFLVLCSPVIMPPLWHASTGLKLMVVAAVMVSAIGSLIDYCAIALRRSPIMLARNVAAAGGRLLLVLLWPGRPGAEAVFFCWLLPATLSLITPVYSTHRGVLQMLRRRRHSRRHDVEAALRSRTRLWWGNHLTSVGGAAGTLILPVVVVDRLGATSAGLFYPSWMLGGIFFMISPAIANAFLAGSNVGRVGLRAPVIFCGKATAALLAAPMLVCLLAPRLVLGVLGPAYAASAKSLLMVLAVSALPDAISNIGVAVLRLRGRFARSAAVNGGITVVTLLLAWPLLARYGIVGGGLAWLCAQSIGAIAVIPLVLRGTARRVTR
jgi:O-antigen/teichoic acid export membrane protein